MSGAVFTFRVPSFNNLNNIGLVHEWYDKCYYLVYKTGSVCFAATRIVSKLNCRRPGVDAPFFLLSIEFCSDHVLLYVNAQNLSRVFET